MFKVVIRHIIPCSLLFEAIQLKVHANCIWKQNYSVYNFYVLLADHIPLKLLSILCNNMKVMLNLLSWSSSK